ncbi:MAG TPA: tetratricopeptide repeat protein, partial [Polyangiaceae bacterium]|nr:tetratricopeptide repeat protein [Polyangiaceae bacterium]
PLLESNAWAQNGPVTGVPSSASPADADRAQAQFNEGVRFRDQGNYAEAARSFEASLGAVSSPGTLLNLGLCYDKLGRLRDAEQSFRRAFDEAAQEPDPTRRQGWSDAAQNLLAQLSPRIPSVTVRVLDAGTRVQVNDQPVEPAIPLRLDPGRYRLEASAPGKQPYTRDFELAERQQIELAIPRLTDAPIASVATTPPAPAANVPLEADTTGGAHRSFGAAPWILWGSGVALGGSAIVTGLLAESKAHTLKERCPGYVCTDPSLEHTKTSAHTLAVTTDVLWGLGIVSAGVGTVLWFLDTGTSNAAMAGVPDLRADCQRSGCSISARATF